MLAFLVGGTILLSSQLRSDRHWTGYPLLTLLRIALLVRHNAPYKPLDLVLSYCHLTLQNDALETFGPHLYNRAQVEQVVNASPLSMGLLTPSPPIWHPAPKEAIIAAKLACQMTAGTLPNLALGYSIRESLGAKMPVAVGYSSPQEVHASVSVLREDTGGKEKEDEVVNVFEAHKVKNYSWVTTASRAAVRKDDEPIGGKMPKRE